MANTPKDRQSEVTVEDLLRLKKAERPNDAFWGKFDRELHQRMLQTLVKKDPWYTQLMRGVSGRFAQSSAIAVAAAVVAMMVVRPALISTAPSAVSIAENREMSITAATVEVAMADLSYLDATTQASASDYGIEVILGADSSHDAGFERDFGMDSMQVASYDSVSYSADSAHSRISFASAGVASLVY